MRLLLALLPFTCTTPHAIAQTDTFDLYQAVLDRMPIEQARPLLEAEFGPLEDAGPTMRASFANDNVIALFGPAKPAPGIFVFCEEEFSGFSAALPPDKAARILNPHTARDQPAPEVYASGNNVSIHLPAADITFYYGGISTKSSHVSVTHPTRPFLTFKLADICEAGSSKP
ncbi:hypothetical protein [Devosia sp. CAU 1758]